MQYAERFNKRIVNQSKDGADDGDEVSLLDGSKLVIFLRHRFLPFLIQFSFLASESERSEEEAGIITLPMMEDGFRESARRFSSVSLEGTRREQGADGH